METIETIIGVDVGGSNTDAVIIDRSSRKPKVLAQAKTLTTSDVTTGVKAAIHLALLDCRNENQTLSVQRVNIGTTHFINAVVEGKQLAKVAVIRLCGTASRKLPPFADFPEHLSGAIRGSIFMVNGGYQYDGSEITSVDEAEINNCVDILKSNDERNIVVSGIFSPVRDEQERRVLDIIRNRFPRASVTLSHEIGKIGLLERENAAVLNESIKPLCLKTIKGFREALDELGLKCPLYLTQNDGTILGEQESLRFPVFSFASGATNSMRGAAFLTGLQDAIVVDIGGTSTDVGLLSKGFAREASAEVKVGGIRTNFRMPDVISIGLGGGSYVNHVNIKGKDQIKVGPLSAGYRIVKEAHVFAQPGAIADRILTATDVAVASGIANVGLISNVKHLDKGEVAIAVQKIHDMVKDCIDQMRFNDRDLPLILVGGGSIIVDRNKKFDGVSEAILPESFDVANAVGAALSQIAINKDQVVDLEQYIDKPEMETKITAGLKEINAPTGDAKTKLTEKIREEYLSSARQVAIAEIEKMANSEIISSGADQSTITTIEKDDVPLVYIPGNATRIKLKVVGDLQSDKASGTYTIPQSIYDTEPERGQQTKKQTVANTGVSLTENSKAITIEIPNIDDVTGEWLLSEYDIECLHIGAGILGCGGGGNPHISKVLALRLLRNGKKIRVVTPSRFLKNADPENDLVTIVAFMGAPVILYEKLMAGNETVGALQCMQDIYSVGGYNNGTLLNTENVEIKKEDGIVYIDDYQLRDTKGSSTKMGKKKVVALMSAEIGGLNCIEPLIVATALDLPVLDCDGMGRAFPELQMFTPFIYGNNPYPSTLADDKGRRAVVLHADGPKTLENHFRKVVVSMGCSGGVVLSHFTKDQVLSSTVLHSLSHSWRIGDSVLRARAENKSPVEAVIKSQSGKMLIYGKVSDLKRETTGGFTKGKMILHGLDEFDGQTVRIEFQNEFLVASRVEKDKCHVLACVPDLISIMDPDTAQPIPTEEVRFGIRVVVVAMPVSPMMSSEQALKFVGPQAFGYADDVKYEPVCEFSDVKPVPPE